MTVPRTRLKGEGAGQRWMCSHQVYPIAAPCASPSHPLFLSDGRVAGRLELWRGRLSLLKVVRARRHMLRRPPAWAVDERVLQQAQAAGAELVVIHDRESGATHWAPLTRLFSDGFVVERGHGSQRALPLSRWTTERPGQPQLILEGFPCRE